MTLARAADLSLDELPIEVQGKEGEAEGVQCSRCLSVPSWP
jgi:hypothetical protein